MSAPQHVFLTYSRIDTPIMHDISKFLRQSGIRVWTDESLEPGTPSWRQAIARAIENAGCMLVILSPEAKESKWVGEELSYAEVLKVQVFPVLARGDERTSVPFGLSGVQWADIRNEETYQEDLSTLAHTIAAFLRDHENQAQVRQQEEADKEHTGYFYPNKWVRIVLLAVEEVMGRDSTHTLLKGAGLPHLVDHYPPDNMQKEFPFDDFGRLQQTIWEMYGTRGLRALNLQAGHQAFEDGLTQFRTVVSAAAVAMKASSLETRMHLGLEFFAKFFNEVSDQQIVVSEDDDHWYWTILRCPLCWGWQADEPVCYLATGVLQAAVDWVTSGEKFDITETECVAQGHSSCVITITKNH